MYSSFSASCTRSITLVIHLQLCREDGIVKTTTYLSFVTHIFHSGYPCRDGEHKTDDIHLTTGNPWFSIINVALSNPISRKTWLEAQAGIPYQLRYVYSTDTAVTLLHINGKFTNGKLKSSLLPLTFSLDWPSLSISRCSTSYETHMSLVYSISR